jgi:hypothetical protein
VGVGFKTPRRPSVPTVPVSPATSAGLHTIARMLLLLVATSQQLPPINVTLQQPPGLPLWATTLVSAGVGAVFAILVSIAIEFVKRWISKREDRKLVAAQLAAELLQNLNAIDNLRRVLEDFRDASGEEVKWLESFVLNVAASLKMDRYTRHFDNDKDIVYQLDSERHLERCYSGIRLELMRFLKKFLTPEQIKLIYDGASSHGHAYLNQHGIAFVETGTRFYEIYCASREYRQSVRDDLGDSHDEGAPE